MAWGELAAAGVGVLDGSSSRVGGCHGGGSGLLRQHVVCTGSGTVLRVLLGFVDCEWGAWEESWPGWPGLAWPGLAWPGLAWLGLAWAELSYTAVGYTGLGPPPSLSPSHTACCAPAEGARGGDHGLLQDHHAAAPRAARRGC